MIADNIIMMNGKKVADKLKKINLLVISVFLEKLFLFFLPWQTVWIINEIYLHGLKWQYGTFVLYFNEIVVLAATVLWLWQKFNNKQKIIANKKIFSCIIIFLIFTVLSALWSAYPLIALQQSLHLSIAILSAWLIISGPLERENARKWFIFGAIIPALIGIWQFLSQSSFAFKYLGIIKFDASRSGAPILGGEKIGRILRAYSSFPSPNIFGGYIFMAISFLLADWKIFLQKYKILFSYSLLCIFTLAIFYSFSRSALLSLGLFILIFSWQSWQQKEKLNILPITATIILLIIQAIIFLPITQNRISATSKNETRSLHERIDSSKEAWQIFQNNKWLGVGYGNYTALSGQTQSTSALQNQPVHNSFLLFIAELGIIGCFLFGWILKINITQIKKFALPIFFFLPILLLDHYLSSLPIGLLLFSVYVSASSTLNPPVIHKKAYFSLNSMVQCL